MPLTVHEGDEEYRRAAAEDFRQNIQRSAVRRALKQGERLNPAYVHELMLQDQGFAYELYREGLIEELPGQ